MLVIKTNPVHGLVTTHIRALDYVNCSSDLPRLDFLRTQQEHAPSTQFLCWRGLCKWAVPSVLPFSWLWQMLKRLSYRLFSSSPETEEISYFTIFKSTSRHGMPRKATYIKSLNTSEILRLPTAPVVPEHLTPSASVGMGIASYKSKADKLLRPFSPMLTWWDSPKRPFVACFAGRDQPSSNSQHVPVRPENSPRRACMEGKLLPPMCPKSELCVSELKSSPRLFCGSFPFCTNKTAWPSPIPSKCPNRWFFRINTLPFRSKNPSPSQSDNQQQTSQLSREYLTNRCGCKRHTQLALGPEGFSATLLHPELQWGAQACLWPYLQVFMSWDEVASSWSKFLTSIWIFRSTRGEFSHREDTMNLSSS